jgi:hypothetical protein
MQLVTSLNVAGMASDRFAKVEAFQKSWPFRIPSVTNAQAMAYEIMTWFINRTGSRGRNFASRFRHVYHFATG